MSRSNSPDCSVLFFNYSVSPIDELVNSNNQQISLIGKHNSTINLLVPLIR